MSKKTRVVAPPWWDGVQWTLGAGAVGAVGELAGFSPLLGFGVGAVGALCSVLREGSVSGSPARVCIQLGRWSGVGGWLTWAWTAPGTPVSALVEAFGHPGITGDPTSALGLGVLAAGAQIAAHAPIVAGQPAAPGLGAGLRSSSGPAQQWEADILAVSNGSMRGVVVQQVRPWANGFGEDVDVVLPDTGVTAGDLKRLLPGLASRRDLPRGCTIDLLEPDGGRRTVVLSVSTVNRLEEVLDYPRDYAPRSLLDGIPFGEFANSKVASAPIREGTWLVVGKPGSGKTTLLHGLTATIGLCSDALVWHIDLNGGSLTQPWIEVWLDGRVERCPIDWPAPTVDEGIRMLNAAVRIAKHRKVAYRKLKRQHNVSLLPISPDLPAIEIIIDEGAEALAAAGRGPVAELAAQMERIQQIARDAAVNEVISALRGTSDLIPATVTSLNGVPICMQVEKEKEMAAVFDWNSGVDYRDLRRKGAGFVRTEAGEIRQFQAWNILPAQIEEVALLIARQRPDLDEASAQAAGEDYATRYERMRMLFADDAAPEAAPPPAPAPPRPPAGGSVTASWGDLGGMGGVAVLEQPAQASPAEAGGNILAEALRVMDAAGVDRMSREQLAAELTGGDEDALRKAMVDAGAGAPHSIRQPDGTPARGWYRREVEAATAVTAA